MQFKYPEILYALFLLIIPIIIHLFQLRKFEKTAFTNVKFLKKIELQTRKSSKLKKYLLLASRLLLFSFLILAFAQPFFGAEKHKKKQQTIVYLDNSLSMQAKQGNVSLLQNAIQSVLKNNSIENISVLTNDAYYKNLKGKDLKNKLLSIKKTFKNPSLKTILQQADTKFKTQNEANLVLISDFQNLTDIKLDSVKNYSFVQVLPEKKENISLDTIYIAEQDAKNIKLKVGLKSHKSFVDNLAISMYNNAILLGKINTSLEKDTYKEITFTIPFTDSFNGKVVLEESFFPFDNTLFFTITKPKRIRVLGIGSSNDFLSKIYTEKEFNFINNTLNQVDYNSILKQNLIVLNELEEIPNSLQKVLLEFNKKGGSIVIIPSENIKKESYNLFFKSLGIGKINSKNETELKITNIEFSHPILKTVFEKEVKNFQYPKVNSFYETSLNNSGAILKFENSTPFINQISTKNGKIYWLNSAINTNNSNFKNSPLIVPIFYNFGQKSYQINQLYYLIGKENIFNIETTLNKDEVLQIESSSKSLESFIPLQQIQNLKTRITTNDNPKIAGIYHIKNKETVLNSIAFNYDRTESNVQYSNIKELVLNYKNANFSTDISKIFTNISQQNKPNNYWRWCVIIAILFFLLEIGILKFWKK